MTINRDKAFEIENGIVLSKDGAYLTGGIGDPTGVDAPVGTWYLRLDTKTLWYKHDTLATDWRQIAASDITAIDTSQNPVVNTTMQAILTELLAGDTSAVSQTLAFGNGGNTAQNSYLPNQGVPSNIVGFPVGLTNPKIRSFFLGNENVRTGNVLVQQRTPAGTGTWTTIYTAVLNNQRYVNFTGLDVPVVKDAELAVFTEISLKNVKIVMSVNGDAA